MKRHLACLFLMGLLISPCKAEPLDRVIAVVNDQVITASELDTQFSLLKQQLASKGTEAPPDNLLRKQVLQRLIDTDLQLQLAKRNSITIDNDEVDKAIQKIAEINKFSTADLRKAIEGQGMTWKAYRAALRKEILISQLQQKAVGKETIVTPKQVEDYLKSAPLTDNSEVVYHLENIIVPLPAEPTTEQLQKVRAKAFAIMEKAKKGDDFSQLMISESSNEFLLEGGDLGERHLAELPDLFAKEVTKMQKGQIRGPLRAGNGLQLIKLLDVKGLEPQHHQVTKVHVRHILIKQEAGTTLEEAKKQAFNVYHQIKAGKDFVSMAKRYSLDVASGVKGGDLGWVGPGEVVPEFEKVMNTLPLHVVSKPVKSGFGWHLIEVLERKTVDDSLAFKRQQVRQFLQQKKFAEAIQNWQQHLRMDSYIKIMDKDLA